MKILIALAATLAVALSVGPADQKKVVCYYDSRSFVRESQARMLPTDLDPALSYCSHLVYGYAAVQADTFKMVPLNENLDVDKIHQNYRTITNYKAKYPALKVLLSVGGDVDDPEDVSKYNHLLESPQARTSFVNSAVLLADQYGFDGIDLAWQFPKIKPKKIRSSLGNFWHSVKKTFGTTPVDDKESEHREGHTALVRELRQAINVKPNRLLSITVLPNVNASIYYDVPSIINLVDIVNLEAFDYATPQRNPKEADYASPIYAPQNRNPLLNVDAVVTYWLQSGAPANKLILGVSTFGRTWKLDSESQISGVPPIHADQAGEAGPYTKTDGLLSYAEVCSKLIDNPKVKTHKYRKVNDPSKRFGTYAFRLPDDSGDLGSWVSYEDPETVTQKALYVKAKNLGGVSVLDLSLDDFRGLCSGDKYPILRALRYNF